MSGVRTLVVWCPDWPVVATGAASDALVAVMAANRVIACSAAARVEGVRRGLRRREAQGRCPGLEVVEADPGRDARAFEPVAVAVEAFTSRIEIVRPGVIALGTRGPSRYFGGDRALAEKIAGAVDAVTDRILAVAGDGAGPDRAGPDRAVAGDGAGPSAVGAAGDAVGAGPDRPAGRPPQCRIGVADGRFPAEAAARHAGRERITVVEVGESRRFVAPLSVSTIPYPDLASLLGRLAIRTLGELAALPPPAVLARFGPDGAEAHRLARGLDPRPLAARTPPPDLAVSALIDPPAQRIDTAAFVARSLAEELHARLGALGLGCTRVAIEAETEHGEHLVRLWRHDGTLTAGAIAERVRWQLDSWLRRGGTTGGLTLLRLVPDEVRPDGGRQLGFWGGAADEEGVARTLARVQGILGPEGVMTAVLGGGRGPAQQVRLVPWGDPREPARPGVAGVPVGSSWGSARSWESGPAGPTRRRSTARTEIPSWPGQLPGPAPAVVHVAPLKAEVRDAAGGTVAVSGRGVVSADPVAVSITGGPWLPVEAWAGPWPVEERWWDAGRRRAWLQVALAGGNAHLLAREDGQWWVEATYD